MGNGLAGAPEHETNGHEDGSEAEIGNPLAPGEEIDIEESDQPHQQDGQGRNPKGQQDKPEGDGAAGQKDGSQHLVMEDVEGVVNQTQRLVDDVGRAF